MGTRKKKRTRKQKNHIMSADELKQKGNEAFKRNEFKLACEIFTEAIELDATNHVLYSNRSAARAGNNEFDLALSDAEKVIELKPDFVKGYGRKGAALFGKGEFESETRKRDERSGNSKYLSRSGHESSLARYERKPESGDGTPKESDDHGESEKVNQRRDRPNALRGRVQ